MPSLPTWTSRRTRRPARGLMQSNPSAVAPTLPGAPAPSPIGSPAAGMPNVGIPGTGNPYGGRPLNPRSGDRGVNTTLATGEEGGSGGNQGSGRQPGLGGGFGGGVDIGGGRGGGQGSGGMNTTLATGEEGGSGGPPSQSQDPYGGQGSPYGQIGLPWQNELTPGGYVDPTFGSRPDQPATPIAPAVPMNGDDAPRRAIGAQGGNQAPYGSLSTGGTGYGPGITGPSAPGTDGNPGVRITQPGVNGNLERMGGIPGWPTGGTQQNQPATPSAFGNGPETLKPAVQQNNPGYQSGTPRRWSRGNPQTEIDRLQAASPSSDPRGRLNGDAFDGSGPAMPNFRGFTPGGLAKGYDNQRARDNATAWSFMPEKQPVTGLTADRRRELARVRLGNDIPAVPVSSATPPRSPYVPESGGSLGQQGVLAEGERPTNRQIHEARLSGEFRDSLNSAGANGAYGDTSFQAATPDRASRLADPRVPAPGAISAGSGVQTNAGQRLDPSEMTRDQLIEAAMKEGGTASTMASPIRPIPGQMVTNPNEGTGRVWLPRPVGSDWGGTKGNSAYQAIVEQMMRTLRGGGMPASYRPSLGRPRGDSGRVDRRRPSSGGSFGTKLSDAYDKAFKNNKDRENEVRGIYDGMIGGLLPWLRNERTGIQDAYNARTNKGMDFLKDAGVQTKKDIEVSGKRAGANMDQSMINRGLYNTTIRDNAQRSVLSTMSDSLARANERTGTLKSGTYAGLSGDALNAAQGLLGMEYNANRSLPQSKADFIERIGAQYPNMGQWLQAGQQTGQGIGENMFASRGGGRGTVPLGQFPGGRFPMPGMGGFGGGMGGGFAGGGMGGGFGGGMGGGAGGGADDPNSELRGGALRNARYRSIREERLRDERAKYRLRERTRAREAAEKEAQRKWDSGESIPESKYDIPKFNLGMDIGGEGEGEAAKADNSPLLGDVELKMKVEGDGESANEVVDNEGTWDGMDEETKVAIMARYKEKFDAGMPGIPSPDEASPANYLRFAYDQGMIGVKG